MLIPKTIHQIWSSCNKPLPKAFVDLANTWKEFHPDWQYIFWDDQKMTVFMQRYYPDYVNFTIGLHTTCNVGMSYVT